MGDVTRIDAKSASEKMQMALDLAAHLQASGMDGLVLVLHGPDDLTVAATDGRMKSEKEVVRALVIAAQRTLARRDSG
jgi:hypothetical protein